MAQDVVVVTDSAASIPSDVATRYGVVVVPLEVRIDDEVHPDTEVSADAVLEALVAGRRVTTSQPSAGAFADAYRAAATAGARAVVSVHLSGGISGTANSARLGAETAGVPVTVVDSRTLGMATGFAAMAAATFARDGATADEAATEARRVAASSTILITMDTLEYLKRGGRISPAAAALGGVLGVRPVLGMRDGIVTVVRRVRATARARETVVEMAEVAIGACTAPGLAVMALPTATYADDVAAEVGARHGNLRPIVRTPVATVLAVHGGPGAFALVVADLPEALR